MPRATTLVLVAGWALLLAAWTIGNPPFAAPDETGHYVRAVGVAEGQLHGRAAPESRIGITPKQVEWSREGARAIRVPAGLAPPAGCVLVDPHVSAGCLDDRAAPPARTTEIITPLGGYEPLPYFAPALVVGSAGSPDAALRWGRAAGALLVLALLAVALACVRDPADPRSLLGPLLAVTPMVLFCGGSLNGSGMEIAAGIAFLAALLRITRVGPVPPWVWPAAGVCGAVLAASRAPGPLWVALGLGVAVLLMGPRPAWQRLREGGPWAAGATAVLGAGTVANRLWEAAWGPDTPLATHAVRYGFDIGLSQWWEASVDIVGKFGAREYPLPLWVPLGWLLLVLVLGVLAWRASGSRERLTLGAVAVASATLPLLLYVFVIRNTGFGLQGRHVLPFVVALPLLGGELAYRRRAALPRAFVVAVPAAVGLLQFAAFYLSSRRYAVGVDGPLFFLGEADWSPPLGWGGVLALALAGGTAIAALSWLGSSPMATRGEEETT